MGSGEHSLPLQLAYHIVTDAPTGTDGPAFKRTNIIVLQRCVVADGRYKPGSGHFTHHAGARFYQVRNGGEEQPDRRSPSYTMHNYKG